MTAVPAPEPIGGGDDSNPDLEPKEERDERQADVKKLRDEGYAPDEIAEELEIAVSTVKLDLKSLQFEEQAAASDLQQKVERWEDARIESRSTHGTGCTLASAIAAGLAQKMSLKDAVARARLYVRRAIETAPGFGSGHGPLNHAVTVRE